MDARRFDYVVIGAGVGGLLTAALLVARGFRVCVLERHTSPGGYGHSFHKRGYTFCAELHYLWNCGPNGEFTRLLRELGLDDTIRFVPLNSDGFDRVRFPSFQYDFARGLARNVDALSAQFPGHRPGLTRYFGLISAIDRELYQLPLSFSWKALWRHPLKFRHVAQYRNWTTQQLFEQLGFPLALRSILAGQSGDLGLPPSQASLLIQAAITCGYDRGAYVPDQGYQHLFQTLVDWIRGHNGSQVQLGRWVTRLVNAERRVTGAATKTGEDYAADRFVYNGDPKLLNALLGDTLPANFLARCNYQYSASSFTLYLGIRGLDLRRFGFGDWNLWHYPHDNLDQCYHEQLEEHRLDNPMLFVSTPTLHGISAVIAPDDCQQLVVCTPCSYAQFAAARRRGHREYRALKREVTERILDQIERHYVPSLRHHLDLVVAGTPLTNERFVLAPEGNAYGANLTPENINVGKLDYRTPLENLWLVGATAGAPSFAGGTHFAALLAEQLSRGQACRGQTCRGQACREVRMTSGGELPPGRGAAAGG